ncbi:MAG: UDP-N-acetylmuramoyl-L-alanine--D-glutamate ligase [Rhodospirillales bacterium]|nr:UDP-N-acetylmuramoyl-L-alanine--D-glutamate ligase [Rhodospirillales bacterium]
MIKIKTRRDQKIALFGLGTSGLITARALSASGNKISAWDDDPIQRKKAKQQNIILEDLYISDFDNFDALVLAPGVPFTHQPHTIAKKALLAKTQIIGDVELLIETLPETKFIGITGTNGKSTTTALVGHMLEKAGIKRQIGGNLGPPALSLREPVDGEIIVLEVSSYQLDLTKNASFDIAAFLNLSSDHLDRHGNIKNYFKAKSQIFRQCQNSKKPQIAIIGIDDEFGRSLHNEISINPFWQSYPISTSEKLEDGFYVTDEKIYDMSGLVICDLRKAKNLLGIHNWQNALAAAAIGYALEIDREIIAESIMNFHGLPHRMERVDSLNGITFVNDSKATNLEASERALACYKNIFWIAGGRSKGLDCNRLADCLSNIHHVFLIGESSEEFEKLINNKVKTTLCGNLRTAVREAYNAALVCKNLSPTVLLSPACASFDQWENYEARGNAFRQFITSFRECVE